MSTRVDPEKKSDISAYILLFLTAIIWGGTWPVGRWLVSEEVGGDTIPPMMIAAIRYFIALVCFLVILQRREGNINVRFVKQHWKIFTFMSLTSVTIYQIGYLIGEYYTSASDASVIISIQPILIMIMAVFGLQMERLDKIKLFGAVLSFLGVLVIFSFSPNNETVPNRFLGNMLIILAAISYAMYVVSSKYFFIQCEKGSFQPSSLYVLSWVSIIGFITTYPFALILNPEYLNPTLYFQIPDRLWLGIGYLAILSTIGGYWFYLEGIKRLGATRASIFQNFVPPIGVFLSVILLQEKLDIFIHTTSIILILTGIALVNSSRSHRNTPKSSSE